MTLQFNGTSITFPDGSIQTSALVGGGVSVWSDSEAYTVNDIVLHNNTLYVALNSVEPPAGSTPDTDTYNWSSLSGPQGASGSSIVWRGSWTSMPSPTYEINDAVEYNGSAYICTIANSGIEPTDSNYWGLMTIKGESFTWRGQWYSMTDYYTDDVVHYNGNAYIAINDNNSIEPNDTLYWALFASSGAQGIPGISVWNSSLNYNPDALVLYNNLVYVCIQYTPSPATTTPDNDPSFWQQISTQGPPGDPGPAGTSITNWSTGQNYMDGTIVTHNNEFYEALSDNNSWSNPNEEPGTGDNWLLLSSTASSLVTVVRNETGNYIPPRSVVYINGANGNKPTVTLAQADAESTSAKTFGITADGMGDGSFGRVVVFGSLTGVNTDPDDIDGIPGAAPGVTIYLSPTTPGGITTTKPTAPNHMVSLGKIIRTHVNQGVIEVSVQNGYELEELHNVSINGPILNNILSYDDADNLWKNTSSIVVESLSINGPITEGVITNWNTYGSIAIDLEYGTIWRLYITDNTTVVLPSAIAGRSLTVFIYSVSNTSYPVGFSSSSPIWWNLAGNPPSINSTGSSVHVITFVSDGDNWYGSVIENFVATV